MGNWLDIFFEVMYNKGKSNRKLGALLIEIAFADIAVSVFLPQLSSFTDRRIWWYMVAYIVTLVGVVFSHVTVIWVGRFVTAKLAERDRVRGNTTSNVYRQSGKSPEIDAALYLDVIKILSRIEQLRHECGCHRQLILSSILEESEFMKNAPTRLACSAALYLGAKYSIARHFWLRQLEDALVESKNHYKKYGNFQIQYRRSPIGEFRPLRWWVLFVVFTATYAFASEVQVLMHEGSAESIVPSLRVFETENMGNIILCLTLLWLLLFAPAYIAFSKAIKFIRNAKYTPAAVRRLTTSKGEARDRAKERKNTVH